MNVPTSRWFLAALCGLVLASPVRAENPPPTQLFYVPFPEDNQLAGFNSITTVAVDPMAVFVTFSAATDHTVIYYDHWEDGYERDITNPAQSTTLVFGDGNPANGYPPGNASDLIPAGTVFSLRNYVNSTNLQAVLDYDARDKVASYKPISLTKTIFPASTNTLLGGCVEVFEKGLWGTEYRVPVGTDMPTTTPTSSLTWDADIFSYTALSIMAGANGATVQIDADNNGAYESTITLAEGETTHVTNVLTGGRVVSDLPVQVAMFTGRIGSTYQSRDTSLLPTYRWSTSYYAPVSTSAAYGTAVFLYNPGSSDISVSYDYRNSATAYTTASVTVPAGGNARVTLAPSDSSTNFGAYHFYTTGGSPPVFYAFCAVDSTSTTNTNNQAFDGGFTLVGQPSLTTQVLVSLGIGRDPYSTTSPTQNGNPVWLTTAGNGHTQETVYVDYNGDNAGPLSDPNGNKYDVALSLRELEQAKIYDPDGDQSGLLVYTLNPAVKIAAAWAQDPLVASTAQPGLDVSTLLPPLREGEGGKKSSLANDADGDGEVSAGDTLEYDIRAANSARAAIPGPFAIQDNLPVNVGYVAGSARYRFSVNGNWQAWVGIPDDGSGTPFPLDGGGFSVPGSLGKGQQLQVVFNATIKDYANLSGAKVVNTGFVEISPYGLVLPIDWTDVIHGGIGDRVWSDLDGDGVQDAGETGIAGIDVFADTNHNGVWDSGEPKDVTDSNGQYLLTGLVAGAYTVRVDITDISAIDVGYGPTSDLDGLATLNSASVTLAGAQDRVDADFGYRIGASVGDRVWMDLDADGVQEGGESGISGVRVYLDLDNDDVFDAGEPNAITSMDGVYYIGNLGPGAYAVRVDTTTLPSGVSQTYDLAGGLDHEASVTLLASEHRGDFDFGYRGNLSLGDLVWEDLNADGLVTLVSSTTYSIINGRVDINNDGTTNNSDDGFIGSMRIINGYADIDNDNAATVDNDDDGTFLGIAIINGGFDVNASGGIGNTDDGSAAYEAYESGIAGVRVFVDMDNDGVFDAAEPAAVTNGSGNYSITNLYNGTFTVRVDTSTLPASHVQTHDLTSPLTDHTASVVLSGANRTDVDFGYRNDSSIGDLIWNDRDGDGVRDAGEPGIEGVIVYIDADNDNAFDQGLERYDVTDVNGAYWIENLAAGTHAVRVEFSTLPQGCVQTYDLDAALDHETSRTVGTSENAADVDFGYRASASFGDFVWNDLDADGVQDGGESGINGVRVFIDTNGDGLFDSATEPSSVTNASGTYSIGNLLPGTYTARVDPATLPGGSAQTYDLVGGLDHAATFSLSATQARTDVDFGYAQQVVIGNFAWHDVDADGSQDGGEPGLDGVEVTLFNAANDTIAGATVTAEGGAYEFVVMPGEYYVVFTTPAGWNPAPADQGADTTDSDADPVTGRTSASILTGGQEDPDLDAGFYQPAVISGRVSKDADNDGDGDVDFPGVLLELLDGSGNPVDGDPITSGVQPRTAVTGVDGSYRFDNLMPGSYQVRETQPPGYGSVSDADGGNRDLIGDSVPITLVSGQEVAGRDFIEIELGSISGYVYAGSAPIAGVTLALLDQTGAPVDGNPNTPGLQPFTTVTDSLGRYSFKGVVPGVYQVREIQPYGYNSFGDVDGGDIDVIGDVTPITIAPGQHNENNNFVETLDTCPDDWAEWKFQHPGEQPSGNPDADAYDNFAEFAFAMPFDNGAGSPWLGSTGWIIRPSSLAPGTLEGVFIRPKGAHLNATYSLQYASDPGSPTVWQEIVVAPAMVTAADNGDCTETVTIHDLENLTGLTGGRGIARIKAVLDDDGGGDGEIDHASHSETEGWRETPLELCCRTYNNPFLRETGFTGTISSVAGQAIAFALSGGGGDLSTILASGGDWFLEVTSGDHEGHRFDVVSASGNTILVANDSSLESASAPFNTLTGPAAATLAGDTVSLRRHWTAGELFPPSGFGATGSQASADQIQTFAEGSWRILWLYDQNDGNPGTARWVDAADAGMADQGSLVIPPGQGLFFNNRTSVTSILAYGEVRANGFFRPLAVGNNLVGGGYPVAQSANGAGGRHMNPAAGFFGSRDFKTADSFFLWNADVVIGAKGYSTYFLLNGAPVQPSLIRWVKVGDVSLLARDAEILFEGNRAVFVRSKDGSPGYSVPSPWSP
jgi:hypothetical protein